MSEIATNKDLDRLRLALLEAYKVAKDVRESGTVSAAYEASQAARQLGNLIADLESALGIDGSEG